MKTRKKPYTTHELFHEIDSILKEKGLLPSFLDYGIASGKENQEIRTCLWDPVFKTRFGGSEGIYLDLYLEGELDSSGKNSTCVIGTYKTLNGDDESFRQMAILGANFALETNHWTWNKLDDFTWTGYDIDYLLDGDVKRSVTCYDSWENLQRYLPERARHTPHDCIVVTDNASGRIVFRGSFETAE